MCHLQCLLIGSEYCFLSSHAPSPTELLLVLCFFFNAYVWSTAMGIFCFLLSCYYLSFLDVQIVSLMFSSTNS